MPVDPSNPRDVYSVSRLNSEVRAVLEGSFPLLWVEGEISNLSLPRSGHLYFSLKDAHAQVRCALFRSQRNLLRQQPANGDQVRVRARIGFYEPRGDFQLIVEHLEPAGAGAAQRAFEALKQKLQAEGLFDPARKRELPPFPRRIGVITSPSGAAIRDVLEVLRGRAPHIRVVLYPALVQGREAPADLLAALQVAQARAECDVLLLTRGGGSAEDLAAFNDEALARAVAACPIPVVSAVGHEIDFAITDFVADRRAPTPSAAAELLSPDAAALARQVGRTEQRLHAILRRRLAHERQQLERLAGRLQRAAPSSRLRQQQQRLDGLDLRVGRVIRATLARRAVELSVLDRRLQAANPKRRLADLGRRFDGLAERLHLAWSGAQARRRERLAATGRHLHAVSPLATLQRGYSVLREPDSRRVIASVGELQPGATVEALLADGSARMEVREVEPDGQEPRRD
jgi:exodeoxyribonuclease VII large subunit